MSSTIRGSDGFDSKLSDRSWKPYTVQNNVPQVNNNAYPISLSVVASSFAQEAHARITVEGLVVADNSVSGADFRAFVHAEIPAGASFTVNIYAGTVQDANILS